VKALGRRDFHVLACKTRFVHAHQAAKIAPIQPGALKNASAPVEEICLADLPDEFSVLRAT